MRNDSDRLQWQTEKNYIMNTFHNGLRCIQTDSKTAQQYVLLCLALAVAALIMVSGGSGEDVISVVFRPFVNFIRVIAWLAECLGVIYLFGYIPHSWSYYDDFSRAGICNQAHEAPLLVKANRDGNIQQLTFSLKGCPLEYWEDNRTTIESALNVTVLSITQGSNNQLFDLRSPDLDPKSPVFMRFFGLSSLSKPIGKPTKSRNFWYILTQPECSIHNAA